MKAERSFNLVDEVELARVDAFGVAPSGYQTEALTRAVPLELERKAPVHLGAGRLCRRCRVVEVALVPTWR